jgi:hypothetical protein
MRCSAGSLLDCHKSVDLAWSMGRTANRLAARLPGGLVSEALGPLLGSMVSVVVPNRPVPQATGRKR